MSEPVFIILTFTQLLYVHQCILSIVPGQNKPMYTTVSLATINLALNQH